MSPRYSGRVAPLKRTLIREIFEAAPPEAINLGLGQPDLGAPEVLRGALARAAESGPSGYGPTAGLVELRRDVAATYGDLARDEGDVLITAGCQQATFVTLGCLLDPGDEILVPDPGFPGAARAAVAWSARARSYPLREERGFHLDPEEVAALISRRTRAVLVISPSNPTGTVEPRTTLERLVRITAEAGVALILDDTYRELYWIGEGSAPTVSGSDLSHVVICGGLSKSVALTGWRIGWAVGSDPSFMAKMVALQQTVLTCAATPIQTAAREAFTEAGRGAAAEIRDRFRRRREIVERILPAKGRRAELEGAFYTWIHVGRDARRFSQELLERDGIVVIPGVAFGEAATEWIRVSYAQPEEILEQALGVIRGRL